MHRIDRTVLAATLAAVTPLLSAERALATPIQHVIVIMQENRSFDSYFGTYPGANGIPSGTCVPINLKKPKLGCVAPFHDQHDVNAGGPHGAIDAQSDLDDGIVQAKMDGFIEQQIKGGSTFCQTSNSAPPLANDPPFAIRQKAVNCSGFVPGIDRHDVVGYHTAAEIPNYWAYAQHFVLQDTLFEGVRTWSVASHLDLTSEWSAHCKVPTDVSTCISSIQPVAARGPGVKFPWVNLFQLMDRHGVSWKYYLANGAEPDCQDGEMTCEPQIQTDGVLSLWNPVPGFASVASQGHSYLTAHNPPLDHFLLDVKNGQLPQVSWVIPTNTFSEHPDQGITAGMEYVTSMVNAVMQSPYWQNTAIFIAWDDWGGFYDHVDPPNVDGNNTPTPIQGFGLRVPGLLVSAYARPGMIDHSVLSLDSYATLIEDLFMGSARLDPVALGQPDRRPTIRDELTSVTFLDHSTAPIGRLINEFDFAQTPLPPLVLSTHIPTLPTVKCQSADKNNPQHCKSRTVTVMWEKVAGKYVPGPFTYHVLRDGVDVPACTGAATSCDDMPGSGVHYYRIYSVDTGNVASPPSAATEADEP